MYSVEMYQRIRRACHVEGMSIREAAKQFGMRHPPKDSTSFLGLDPTIQEELLQCCYQTNSHVSPGISSWHGKQVYCTEGMDLPKAK